MSLIIITQERGEAKRLPLCWESRLQFAFKTQPAFQWSGVPKPFITWSHHRPYNQNIPSTKLYLSTNELIPLL